MLKKTDRQFAGFPPDFFAFFEELRDNNERAWFLANKARYEDSVLRPMRFLVADMAPRLAKISRHYVADPKRSVFRIYRDVRFAKDKRPYKEHAAAQFRHSAGRNVHAPGFYVHVAPDEIFVGGGIWMPDAAALKRVRDAIADDTLAWRRALDKRFRDTFGGLSDEYALKRAPKGYDPDHPAIADIKRTSWVVGHQAISRARAQRAGFIDEVETCFAAAKPLMRFLCKALDLPF